MQDTFEISQKTGSVWSTNVQIYQRFMDISDKLGKSQEEIGAVTETVAEVETEGYAIQVAGRRCPVPGVVIGPHAAAPIQYSQVTFGLQDIVFSTEVETTAGWQTVELAVVVERFAVFCP